MKYNIFLRVPRFLPGRKKTLLRYVPRGFNDHIINFSREMKQQSAVISRLVLVLPPFCFPKAQPLPSNIGDLV